MSNEQSVAADKVVSMDYVLTKRDGEELDRSAEGKPLVYLHGAHNIVPGLEDSLVGKSVGDELKVEVPPEKGYGVAQRVKPQRMLRSNFPEEAQITKGAQFLMRGKDERPFPIWVTKVMGKQIHVTTQHPLAGVTLCFAVTILDIRDATDEEKTHGHAHGPGGHHHGDEEEE